MAKGGGVFVEIVGLMAWLVVQYVKMLGGFIKAAHNYGMQRQPGVTLLVEGGILFVFFLIGLLG